MKDDGTLRHARGTLGDGVSDRFDEWKRKQAEKPKDKKAKAKTRPREIITYWDLDKEGFRSFRADRLIEVISDKWEVMSKQELSWMDHEFLMNNNWRFAIFKSKNFWLIHG